MLNPNMKGVRKPFCPILNEYAQPAESAVSSWCRRKGYTVEHHPHGKFKPDIWCESKTEGFYVEVEFCRDKRWGKRHYDYPFRTVHVLERRGEKPGSICFTCRADLRCGIMSFYEDIKMSPLIENPNCYVEKGELVYDVPVECCLPFSFDDTSETTIARMNLDRIHDKLSRITDNARAMEFIRHQPYGMTRDEWLELYEKYSVDLRRSVADNGTVSYQHPTLFD